MFTNISCQVRTTTAVVEGKGIEDTTPIVDVTEHAACLFVLRESGNLFARSYTIHDGPLHHVAECVTRMFLSKVTAGTVLIGVTTYDDKEIYHTVVRKRPPPPVGGWIPR